MAAGDTGRDYEHCLELQKKLNDVEGVSSFTSLFISSRQNLMKSFSCKESSNTVKHLQEYMNITVFQVNDSESFFCPVLRY